MRHDPLLVLLPLAAVATLVLCGCKEGSDLNTCFDTHDNDLDGSVDCDDPDCSLYCDGHAVDDDTGDDDDTWWDDDIYDDDTYWDDDDDVDDDDTWVDTPEIDATHPQHGSGDFYYRGDIFVEFTDEIAGVDVELRQWGDDEIIGGSIEVLSNDREVRFDPYGDGDQHLLPDTPYVATISWPGHADVDLEFSTSSYGNPAPDPAEDIVGMDYLVHMDEARFVRPPGVGSLLSQYLGEAVLILHVEDISEGDGQIAMYAGVLESSFGTLNQDMCIPTLNVTDDAPGLWSNPAFDVGPTDLHVQAGGYSLTIGDFVAGGAFFPDGVTVDGITLEGLMDTRALDELIDPGADEGAACELLASLGIECEECGGGEGTFCVTVEAYGVPADQTQVLAINPETGQTFDHLSKVTSEQRDAWVAEGICDADPGCYCRLSGGSRAAAGAVALLLLGLAAAPLRRRR